MIAALLAVLSVPALAGSDAPALSAALAEARGKLPVVSLRAVGACWERDASAEADRLGLPARFCLDQVGTSEPADAVTPFELDGHGVVKGTPASGLKHISGGQRRQDGGWDLVVDLFDAPRAKERCGRLDHAFAAVYFTVDAVGRPLDGPVEVRGFLLDQSYPCARPAAGVEFLYRRAP